MQNPALELYEIYGLWHVPFWQRTWFKISIFIFFCALVGIIIYFLIKKYKQRAVQLPAWQIALNALDQLKKLQMPEYSARYYAALTHLLKVYISARFGVDVCSLTDQQMCDYIDQHLAYDHYKERLKQIFSAGQLIKFAHHDALEKQMIDDWQHAKDFIQESKEVDRSKTKAMCLLILFLAITPSVYCSEFVKEQLYSCTNAAIRSALAVGTGYAVGRWLGHASAGAGAGALLVVASKEYPHGIAREMGYVVPIAFMGWYCYANMRNQIEDYKNEATQRQDRLNKMNDSCREIGGQLQQLKQEVRRMVTQYYAEMTQIESASALPRSNSCPNLAGQRINSFGQIAMNELY